MREVCSCGASFEIQRDGTTTWTDEGWKRVLEAMKDWRENHKHEFQPEPEIAPEPPTIIESMSQNERALPFGFTRETEGDLA